MTKIHKMFWAWEFDKEEKWLNDMAAKGLHLIAVGYCTYYFHEGVPGAYIYRLELLENTPCHEESRRYIQFLEETGVEYIGSVMRWVYFRADAQKGSFDLFSDVDSRMRYLGRVTTLLGTLAAMELVISLPNFFFYFSHQELTNLVGGLLCFAVGLLIGKGYLQVAAKKKHLQRERFLHE